VWGQIHASSHCSSPSSGCRGMPGQPVRSPSGRFGRLVRAWSPGADVRGRDVWPIAEVARRARRAIQGDARSSSSLPSGSYATLATQPLPSSEQQRHSSQYSTRQHLSPSPSSAVIARRRTTAWAPSRQAVPLRRFERPTRCGYGISGSSPGGSSSVMDDMVARAPGTDTKGSLAPGVTSPASRQRPSSHPAPHRLRASAGSPAHSRRRGRQHYSMRRSTPGGGCRLHGLRTFSRRRQRRTWDGSPDTARHLRRRGRRPRSTPTPPSR
jgi:hypothetical protein